MDNVDVLVVGAGLAGLHAATLLAQHGHSVMLADRRPALDRSIRTTGIFVRKTLDAFPLPADCLGPPIRRVALYPPGMRRPVVFDSSRDEYRVGDMGGLYRIAADAARQAGVHLALGTRYVGRDATTYRLSRHDQVLKVRARFIIGADGARSQVARDLNLDHNRQLIVGAEEVFPTAATADPPTFHCVIDPTLAPGYLAWVVNDGQHVHVGTAGYAGRFHARGLAGTVRHFSTIAPGLHGVERPAHVERRGGAIPVGGLLRRISAPEGLLVGDAAGAVSPLTAGGLDPCLRLSNHAAEVIDEALRTGRPHALEGYDGDMLRASFRGRRVMRAALAQVRTPAAASLAFTVLRTAPGRRAARHILFADNSFPSATMRPQPQ